MKKYIDFIIILAVGVACFALSFLFEQWGTWLRVLGLLVILLAIGFIIFKSKDQPIDPKNKYRKKDTLMSVPERALYYQLLDVVGAEFDVFPQLALVTLVDKVDASYRNELFRVVDFALFDKRNNRPLLVIELNDASHNRDDRKLRDEKVKCILRRAGLKLLTLTLDDIGDRNLRKRIFSAMR
ncbi:MAG: DUF2726 domain-containing protein [Clostridia bacterium]|nr:DUF2726 domain-containing protein [Clostridia bacterium]